MSDTLLFKVRAEADDEGLGQLLAQLAAAGAGEVELLFPGSDDPGLLLLYRVDSADAQVRAALLALLEAAATVEYAEPAAERRLIW